MSRSWGVATRLVVGAIGFVLAGGLLASPALAAGELTAEPEEHDYGFNPVGAEVAKAIVIANEGPDPVRISDIWLEGEVDSFDFGSSSTCSPEAELAVGTSCVVSVVYRASEPVGYREVFLVVDGGEGDIPAVARLTGGSYPTYAEWLVVEPKSTDFGFLPLGSVSEPRTLTVHNPTADVATIEDIVVQRPFRTVSNGCLGSLAPDGRCTFSVVFDPAPPRMISGTHVMSRLSVMAGGTTEAGSAVLMGRSSRVVSRPSAPSNEFSTTGARRQLRRIVHAIPRLLRGGPRRALKAPLFDVGADGVLKLSLRVRPRRALLAHSTTVVDGDTGGRLRFRLTKGGRRTLRQAKEPVQVETFVRFLASNPDKVVGKRAKVLVAPLKRH